jgi:hypothetical protein
MRALLSHGRNQILLLDTEWKYSLTVSQPAAVRDLRLNTLAKTAQAVGFEIMMDLL